MAARKTSSSKRPRGRVARGKAPEPAYRMHEGNGVVRESGYHLLGRGIICDTESRGRATPGGRNLTEIVLDASDGFIPLWDQGVTLRWRFQERSLQALDNGAELKTTIEALLGEALVKWGDAAPVQFTMDQEAWDFEIVVRAANNCNPTGCVLASAFFPGSGQEKLTIYPKMFEQSRKEQVDTLIHEIGHIFGLRHFFAQVEESGFPSVKFGTHSPFSIMNYGELSELTAADRSDLKRLYDKVWSGKLTKINGTAIRRMKAYHTIGSVPETFGAVPTSRGF